MNDFLDNAATATGPESEKLRRERIAGRIPEVMGRLDEAAEGLARLTTGHLARGRDDALLEAARLRAELGRLRKERDEAVAAAARSWDNAGLWRAEAERLRAVVAKVAAMSAASPGPDPRRAEILEGLEKIEEIIAGTLRDAPGTDQCDQCDPWQRLARAGLIVGRLIAAAR